MSGRDELLAKVLALADLAGTVILDHYGGQTEARAKADRSPVTAADEAAEAVILGGLARLAPKVPVVAEEEVAAGRVPALDEGPFWLVDPLDGTREFLSRNGEFTVNIALIEARRPVLGAVIAPALGRAWWGAVGAGAWARDGEGRGERPIAARPRPLRGAVALASRSHGDAETDAFLVSEGVAERINAGSSLKFCLLAEGAADLYPRFGPTMEWDTAAGHAVLAAAGGTVTTRDGAPLLYHKPAFKNPAFIARGA